jgi:hypothetical protein
MKPGNQSTPRSLLPRHGKCNRSFLRLVAVAENLPAPHPLRTLLNAQVKPSPSHTEDPRMKSLITVLVALFIPMVGCQKTPNSGPTRTGVSKPATTSAEHETMKPVTPANTPKATQQETHETNQTAKPAAGEN